MRIYVDMDDVLCETAATLCELAEREFGRSVRYCDVRSFDLQEVFGLTDGEMERFCVVSHERGSILGYPQTPGAADGVRALAAAGHRVDIVTGRPAFTHRDTSEWLRIAGLGGFPVTYVDKYGRSFASGPEDPPTVTMDELETRRYEAVIDDSPVVLRRLARWTRSRVLVFSRPWNESFPLAANMTRVRGWPDVSRLRWLFQA